MCLVDVVLGDVFVFFDFVGVGIDLVFEVEQFWCVDQCEVVVYVIDFYFVGGFLVVDFYVCFVELFQLCCCDGGFVFGEFIDQGDFEFFVCDVVVYGYEFVD